MSLASQKFLFIDCQTTGTSPTNGQIIDIAWSICSANDIEPIIHSCLIALPESATLPSITTEITGLTDDDMKAALPAEEVRKKFVAAIEGSSIALIHYAQFEKSFLKDFLQGELFETLCTSRLAKKIAPSIPNFNIRGVAGFYGMPYHDLKRANDHVRATILIWQGLVRELEKQNLNTIEQVRELLGAKTKTPKAKFEYRITREFRLGLPDRPGIYKMKDKAGKILYVGKATSLFDRVNSYFRGQTGRDKRKLQMLSLTWEMETFECASALEAAVTETDEIKKHDPPYNVSLKGGRRELAFYDENFGPLSLTEDSVHTIGPFSLSNSIEDLKWLIDWREGRAALTRIFYGIYEHDELEPGYKLFLERHPLDFASMSVRSHIAFGYWLWRNEVEVEEEVVESTEEADTSDEPLTPEEAADKFERLYIRAAKSLHRARMLTRLLNSDLTWEESETRHQLEVRDGQIRNRSKTSAFSCPHPRHKNSWADKTLTDYDRMSVLYSEITNRGGEIHFI